MIDFFEKIPIGDGVTATVSRHVPSGRFLVSWETVDAGVMSQVCLMIEGADALRSLLGRAMAAPGVPVATDARC